MIRSQFLGVGSYVPPHIVTNQDLEKLMETTDEWITKRTGIRARHWVGDDECTSDLALKASLQAIKNAGIQKEEIECIIFATLSPDHDFPGTACFLQAKLGLPGIAALDIRQQCTGFIYGISIADQFLRSGMYKTVLVVGAEIHSRGLDKTTRGRDVSVLFGDGAGAVVLRATDVKNTEKDSYLYSTHLHADGSYAKELWVSAPGSAVFADSRLSQQMLDELLHFPQMNGKKVYVHAVEKMSQVLLECLAQNNKKVEDVDIFFFHQANLRINEAVADALKIPREKIFNTIQKYGNTTAATIPLGMSDALKEGALKPGMLVGTAAFGSGFTWGAGLFRF